MRYLSILARLSTDWIADDAILVHPGAALHGPLGVLRVALPHQRLGAEEVHARPDPLVLPRHGALDGLGDLGGFLSPALLWLLLLLAALLRLRLLLLSLRCHGDELGDA